MANDSRVNDQFVPCLSVTERVGAIQQTSPDQRFRPLDRNSTNNRSFAHDNDLIDQAEARFIFDAISAFLRFVKSIEASRFGAYADQAERPNDGGSA